MDNWFDNIVENHYNANFGFKWKEFLVFNLNFDNDSVTADVSDGDEFFHVTINFRQFTVHEKDTLIGIAGKDDVRLDLIKGIVPDVLFDSNVNVFPSSAIDFIADCTCWDMGFLCNHEMAVLNRLNEIFKYNPFLIFSLRGLDLTNIDSFPPKKFEEIFNNSYDADLSFLLDAYLKDYIKNITLDLKDLIDNYDFKDKTDLKLPLDLNSYYQITNNSFKNSGDFVSAVKSSDNPVLDYAFDLIKNRQIIPEMFRLDDNHVYTRWIPEIPPNMDTDDLVKVNGKCISKTDQIIVFVSLIIDDLISVMLHEQREDYFQRDVFRLLVNSSLIDSDRKKSLVSDISRNLSVFNIKYDYIINVSNVDGEFVLEFETDKDSDKMRYTCHVRKLFNYFKLYWTLSEPLRLNNKQFMKYLNNVEPLLKNLNVRVNKSFDIYDTTFKIKLTLDNDEYLTANNLSSSSWMVDLGNCLVTTEEFQKLSIDDSGIIKINDDFYIADSVKFKSLQSDILFLPTNFESYELLQIALLGRYRNLKFDVGSQFRQLLEFSGFIEQPKSLNGQLRPYQITGYSWLIQNIKSGFGSILADDMGLGKTIQVLATILHLKENELMDKQVLIVAPTTLITNWTNEIEKFTDLTYSIYHGDEREFDPDADLILTSYGMVRADEGKFKNRNWFLCVIDEAQNIKNPNSKQTKAIKKIKADNRIALTGTPIENHLVDYWSIFDFTNKGYLNTLSQFKRDYNNPIVKKHDSRALANLKTITQPFILRRLKTDKNIIDDLPEKIVNDIYCDLTLKQSKLYGNLVETGLSELKGETGIKRKGNILKLITFLKQICNHPVQYLKKGNADVRDSAKLELLGELIANIMDAGEKVIIFTQYVEMGRIIEEVLLKMFNREVLFLHGALDRKTRENIINNFQNDKSYPILVATLKTGGVGLNLTGAQNVIHYDLWWNPAVENQATDRAYRIGQDKDVMVYRFITKGTLEEKIDLILKDKVNLADKTISGSETFITELTDDELKEMLELRL